MHVDTANAVTTDPLVASIVVNKRSSNFKIDTGADVTAIRYQTRIMIQPKMAHFPLLPKKLNGPSQDTLVVHGQFTAQIERRYKSYSDATRNLFGQWTY